LITLIVDARPRTFMRQRFSTGEKTSFFEICPIAAV
jgi:hypothetical protein